MAIRVIRVWTYITANEGFSKRTLDYLSYMFTGFLASLFVRRVDLVVGTSPQFFTVCAAYASSLVKRAPWVFELRDIWPESIRVVGAMRQSKVLDLLEKVELFLYSKASAIVSVTHAFRTSLMLRGVNGDKIRVVTNGVDISRFSPRDKDTELLLLHRLQGKFVAGYIGTHGLAHALDTLLDAAKALKAAPDGDRFRIILLGDGANKASLRQRAQTEGLDNVIFVDSVSKDQVVRYWSLLDVSIIHLKKDELFTTVIPSKLFECMGTLAAQEGGNQSVHGRSVLQPRENLSYDRVNSYRKINSPSHQLHRRLEQIGAAVKVASGGADAAVPGQRLE